ncbi:hypothetical protein ACLOJK_039252 [Asimina triloba]
MRAAEADGAAGASPPDLRLDAAGTGGNDAAGRWWRRCCLGYGRRWSWRRRWLWAGEAVACEREAMEEGRARIRICIGVVTGAGLLLDGAGHDGWGVGSKGSVLPVVGSAAGHGLIMMGCLASDGSWPSMVRGHGRWEIVGVVVADDGVFCCRRRVLGSVGWIERQAVEEGRSGSTTSLVVGEDG